MEVLQMEIQLVCSVSSEVAIGLLRQSCRRLTMRSLSFRVDRSRCGTCSSLMVRNRDEAELTRWFLVRHVDAGPVNTETQKVIKKMWMWYQSDSNMRAEAITRTPPPTRMRCRNRSRPS